MSNAMLHAKIFALGLIPTGLLAAFLWAYVRVYESLSGHGFTLDDGMKTAFWLAVGIVMIGGAGCLIYGVGTSILAWWEESR